MERKIIYFLTATDDETGEDIGSIDAFSLESIQEQMHKIETSVKRYIDDKESEQEYMDDDEEEENNINPKE